MSSLKICHYVYFLLIFDLIFFADNYCKWQRYKTLARKLGIETKNVVAFVAIGEILIALEACYSDFCHF